MRSLSLVVVVALCLTTFAASAQPVVELHERVVLDPSSGSGGLGDPRFVQSGLDGGIHVFDLMGMQGHVFRSDGTYERSYGGRGRAEGKLSSISAVHVDAKGRTLIIDQMAARATWFNADGSVFSVHDLDAERLLWPRLVLKEGDRLLLQYRMPDGDGLLHEWSRDFTTHSHQWGSWRDMPFHDDPFVSNLALLRPLPVVRWGNELVFSSPMYHESVFAYGYAEPTRKRVLHGAPLPFDAFERIDVPDGPASPDVTTVSSSGRLAARVRATVLGLMALPSGHLVRFSMRQEASDRQVYAELFSPQGTLVSVTRIEALAAQGHTAALVPLFIGGVDEAGRLYIVDRSLERPVVRVFDVEVAL